MKIERMLLGSLVLFLSGFLALAQPPGRGQGHGRMQGRGMMHDSDHRADMELFHFLLDNGSAIRRTVVRLPEGVLTLTESDDPVIAEARNNHPLPPRSP